MKKRQINVLLIEDNPGDVRLIREMLSEATDVIPKIECIDRLDAGLKRLAKGDINLLLLDLGLPDSKGLDTFVNVHTHAPEMPIVVLTGLDDEELGLKAVQMGAQDYLIKGQVMGNILVRTVRYAIERKRIEEELKKHRDHLKELIEKHKQAEEQQRESEEKYRTLFETLSLGIFIIDQETGQILDVNDAATHIYGYSREEWLNMKNTDVSAEPDKTREATIDLPEYIPVRYHKKKDGTIFPIEMVISTFMLKGRQVVIATSQDITERKKAEEQIRASLAEKEVLLQEIHHRVKNNMQIISSLIKLQSRHIKDEKALEFFKSTRNRIRSMAIIHEKLYKSKDLAGVDFAGYIQTLTKHLINVYGIDSKAIKININIKDVLLNINTAIPCGLIINELLSNSLKYAFPDGKKGEISIAIHPLDKNEMELIVNDNGVGLPEEIDIKHTESLGLHLVTILVEDQLQGDIKLDRTGGTRFYIRIKVSQ